MRDTLAEEIKGSDYESVEERKIYERLLKAKRQVGKWKN
jgi:hypothetical protein